MLDQSSDFSETSTRVQARRVAPIKRMPSSRAPRFAGVDLDIRWLGAARDLVKLLRHTGLERLFSLQWVAHGGHPVWTCTAEDSATKRPAGTGYGVWHVRYDVAEGAGNRAEAHLPRLLETIAARAAWHRVEKRYVAPAAGIADIARRGARPAGDPLQGTAA